MESKLIDHINSKLNDVKGKDIFVAVSGGIDSMVLLFALNKLRLDPTALHVNYNLRDEESRGDEQFIEAFCNEHNISFEVRNVDLKTALNTNGGNLQQRAREIRYNWFEEIIQSNKNAIVLLGHHRDDQIETFFLQAFRGAGMLGLASMPEIKNKYKRPLLQVSRNEIEIFAREENISWREDSSNQSLKYNRNKLRHEFIPLMKDSVPTLKEDVSTLISLFQENYQIIQNKITPIVRESLKNETIPIETLNTLDDEELCEFLRQHNLNLRLKDDIRKLLLAENNKQIPVSHLLYSSLVKSEDTIRLVRNSNEDIKPTLNIEKVEALPDDFDKDSVYLDPDRIEGELKLRRWRESDRIASIGVPGSQLISKILHDNKVLPEERNEVLVLTDKNNILWCPGYKIGRTALATVDSSSILKCSITYKGSEE